MMICILGAVRQEISKIRGGMSGREHRKLGNADSWRGTWKGHDILLVRTGMGKAQAREALNRVFADLAVPRLIISTGYAGATDPALSIGDIVVADRVLETPCATDEDFSATRPVSEFCVDPVWTDKIMAIPAVGVKVSRGGLLTVDKPVCSPQAKKAVGERYRVQAVEMETSAMIALAAEKNVAFLSIRAVSDTVEDELIDVSPFVGADGEVSPLQAGWHVLTHPGIIGEVLTLRQHACRATDTLTHCLASFLQTLPQI